MRHSRRSHRGNKRSYSKHGKRGLRKHSKRIRKYGLSRGGIRL